MAAEHRIKLSALQYQQRRQGLTDFPLSQSRSYIYPYPLPYTFPLLFVLSLFFSFPLFLLLLSPRTIFSFLRLSRSLSLCLFFPLFLLSPKSSSSTPHPVFLFSTLVSHLSFLFFPLPSSLCIFHLSSLLPLLPNIFLLLTQTHTCIYREIFQCTIYM